MNAPGVMVENVWQELNTRFPEVKTDACVVMPNHVHGIIWLVAAPLVGALDEGIRATTRVAPTLGHVIGAFKSITTGQYVSEEMWLDIIFGKDLAKQLLRTCHP